MTLPETMPAAVYVGSGVVEVQEIPVPELHAHRRDRRGLPLRDLRHRPAPRARGMGRQGSVLGHEWSGTIVALGPRRRQHGRNPAPRSSSPTRAGLRRVPRLPARSARRCACDRAAPTIFGGTRRLLRATSTSTPRGCFRSPTASARAPPRSPSRPRSRCTRSLLSGATPGRPGARHRRRPGRAPDDRGAARPRASTTSPCPSRRRPAANVPRPSARKVVAPDALPAARRWDGRSPSPFTLAFECSGHARRVRVGARPARLRGNVRVRRHRRTTSPRVNHNRVIVLELTLHRRVQLRRRAASRRALELLASGPAPARPVDRTRRRRPRRRSATTMHRLAAGELAGQGDGGSP